MPFLLLPSPPTPLVYLNAVFRAWWAQPPNNYPLPPTPSCAGEFCSNWWAYHSNTKKKQKKYTVWWWLLYRIIWKSLVNMSYLDLILHLLYTRSSKYLWSLAFWLILFILNEIFKTSHDNNVFQALCFGNLELLSGLHNKSWKDKDHFCVCISHFSFKLSLIARVGW